MSETDVLVVARSRIMAKPLRVFENWMHTGKGRKSAETAALPRRA